MKTFKTPKGTELPIMDIKGKDYLQAAPRIVWFREERPEWGIETEFLSLSPDHAVCRATIRDEKGRIIAQATSMETKQGFESFVEKAETCAVSRAASFCNFGTLMAQELEEQGRLDERETNGSAKLAEAPQNPKSHLKAVSDPGSYIMRMGKAFTGKRLDECGPHDLNGFANWLREQPKQSTLGNETIAAIEAFLVTRPQQGNAK
jgi:hypothetical protein